MEKYTRGAAIALALVLAGCGVEVGDGSTAVRSGSDESADVDFPVPDDAFDDGEHGDLDEDDDGTDGDGGVVEGDGSEGEDEDAGDTGSDDDTDDDDASDGDSSDDGASGGATPGVYVAPEGGIELGYSFRFEVSEDGSVLHGLEAEVLENCGGEATSRTVTVAPDLAWDIVDGQFSARYEEPIDGGAYYTTLEGSFSGTTATGILRQESSVAGWVCDTYELDFTAELE